MLPAALVFHSNRTTRARLCSSLRDHFETTESHDVEDLNHRLTDAKPRPLVVFAQLLLPLPKGLDLLRLIRRRAPGSEVLALSPVDSPAYAVAVVKAGAFGFLSNDDDQASILSLAYEALERAQMEAPTLASEHDAFPQSRNAGMSQILRRARKLGRNVEHVVLAGEIGTGRKTLARALHGLAPSPGVLRFVDCGEAGGTSLESTLGIVGPYGQGGGADRQPMDNTLCLLDFELLPKREAEVLQRLAEAPVLVRLTNGLSVPVRYRIIAIPAVPFESGERMRGGSDRLHIDLPAATTLELLPLRNRMDDLEILCDQISARWARRYGIPQKRFSTDALEAFASYGWPANLLELGNVIERLTLTCPHEVVHGSMVPLELHIGGWRRGLRYREAMKRLEREFLLRVLDKVGGHRRRAAERLDLSYSTLKFRLRKLNIQRGAGVPSTKLVSKI